MDHRLCHTFMYCEYWCGVNGGYLFVTEPPKPYWKYPNILHLVTVFSTYPPAELSDWWLGKLIAVEPVHLDPEVRFQGLPLERPILGLHNWVRSPKVQEAHAKHQLSQPHHSSVVESVDTRSHLWAITARCHLKLHGPMMWKYFKTIALIPNIQLRYWCTHFINRCCIYRLIFNLLLHNYWREIIAWDTPTTKQASGLLASFLNYFLLAQIALKVAILHPR